MIIRMLHPAIPDRLLPPERPAVTRALLPLQQLPPVKKKMIL
jgi:hypothetical protein